MANEIEELREFLGKMVRAEWVKWAREQPEPKASWLQPWEQLTEPEREVDRRIGEAIWKFSYCRDAGQQAEPSDLRAAGWSVAVHNDYRLNGEAHTFWLFTRGNACVKGEGRTDAEALNQIRAALADDKKEADHV